MKALITGVNGFIASHLADFLLSKNIDVYGTLQKISDNKNIRHILTDITTLKCDATNRTKIKDISRKIKPDYVFHLAAQSFVIASWKNPAETYKTNILGTHYLLEAFKDSSAVICVASSSAIYGLSYPHEIPIKETKEFRPSSPYAVSKAAVDMLAYLYWNSNKTKTIRLRFFNTIGPRKTGSAISEWSQGIAEIEKNKRKILTVGNLKSVIDVTDIRDSVEAIWALIKKGEHGSAYNICTSKGNKMNDILDKLILLSDKEIKIVEDPSKLRPLDDPIFIGDNTKLRNLGWKPKITLAKTLNDTLDYWRNIT